jgi:hypothetical protein
MDPSYWTMDRLRELVDAGTRRIGIETDTPEAVVAAMPFVNWWDGVKESTRSFGDVMHTDRGAIGDVRIGDRYVTIAVHSPIVVTSKAAA